MSLRGYAGGTGFTETASVAFGSYSYAVWIQFRPNTTTLANARIFGGFSSGGTTGFVLKATSSGTAVELACGSGGTTGWGSSANHAGRGGCAVGTMLTGGWNRLAFNVLSSGSAGYTGTSNANQFAKVWFNGADVSGFIAALSGGVAAETGRFIYTNRLSNAAQFDGWIAETTVWLDYQLTDADAATLESGASPTTIAPGKIVLYRSFKTSTGLDAGTVTGTLTAISTGTVPTIDTAYHPTILTGGVTATSRSSSRAGQTIRFTLNTGGTSRSSTKTVSTGRFTFNAPVSSRSSTKTRASTIIEVLARLAINVTSRSSTALRTLAAYLTSGHASTVIYGSATARSFVTVGDLTQHAEVTSRTSIGPRSYLTTEHTFNTSPVVPAVETGLSYATFKGDSIRSLYDIPFQYLSRDHIHAYVDGYLAAFRWETSTRIRLVTPAPAGTTVVVKRITERAERLVTYADGNVLKGDDLNIADTQLLFLSQEALDGVGLGVISGGIKLDENPVTTEYIQGVLTEALENSEVIQALTSDLPTAVEALTAQILQEITDRQEAIAAESAALRSEYLDLSTSNNTAVQRLDAELNDTGGVVDRLDIISTTLVGHDSALVANANALETLTTRVQQTEDTLVSTVQSVEDLQASHINLDTSLSILSSNIDVLSTVVLTGPNSNQSLSVRIASLAAIVDDPVHGVNANASAVDALTTKVFTSPESNDALSGKITQLTTSVTNLETGAASTASAVSSLTTQVNSLGSVSGQLTALSTTVDGHTTTLTQQAQSINGLSAQYVVKVNNNGHVSGFGLASTPVNGVPVSEFAVLADKFLIASPSGSKKAAFYVNGGNVFMDTAFIADASIARAKIGTLALNDLDVDSISANKLKADTTYTQRLFLGDGNIVFDGVNKRIDIYNGAALRARFSATEVSMYNQSGTLLFSSGTGVPWSALNGTPPSSVANSSITLNSNGQLTGAGGGQVTLGGLGAGALASVNQLTSSNVSTYIANGAIGSVQIGNAVIGSAQIANLSVDTIKIANGAVNSFSGARGGVVYIGGGWTNIVSVTAGTPGLTSTHILLWDISDLVHNLTLNAYTNGYATVAFRVVDNTGTVVTPFDRKVNAAVNSAYSGEFANGSLSVSGVTGQRTYTLQGVLVFYGGSGSVWVNASNILVTESKK